MKKKHAIWVILIIVLVIASYMYESPQEKRKQDTKEETKIAEPTSILPKPTVVPEWSEMSLNEKIEHHKKVVRNYIDESEFKKPVDVSYSKDYLLMIEERIHQDIISKYDYAYRETYNAKNGKNHDYLLFDFKNGDILTMHISRTGCSFSTGKFTRNKNGELIVPGEYHIFTDTETILQKDNKLFFLQKDKKWFESDYNACDVSEPASHIFD